MPRFGLDALPEAEREAFNRAIAAGVADPNPYDGIGANQVNLWAVDGYHASLFGYYLEALTIFGKVTGRDPLSLTDEERVADDFGFSREQTHALQQIAHDELAAAPAPEPAPAALVAAATGACDNSKAAVSPASRGADARGGDARAMQALAADTSVRALILEGSGKMFCGGGDLASRDTM